MLRDPRMAAPAKVITRRALQVQAGNKVFIDALDDCKELIIAMTDAVNSEGVLPYLQHESLRVRKAWLRKADKAQMDLWFDHRVAVRRDRDRVLMIRGQDIWSELSHVPIETLW